VPEEKQHASVRCENMHRTEGAHGHMTNEAHGGNKGGLRRYLEMNERSDKMDTRFAVQAQKVQWKKL
jgi:hypothetical protein